MGLLAVCGTPATIEEARLAASSLIALTGVGCPEAVQTLRAMAPKSD